MIRAVDWCKRFLISFLSEILSLENSIPNPNGSKQLTSSNFLIQYRMLRVGAETTLSLVSNKFTTASAKNIIFKRLICKMFLSKTVQHQMAVLSAASVTISRAFNRTGLDFFVVPS
ncbi:hypothetical protein NPIL_461221 [Nephila pilipes]|uniref:Uncharacterized protein n=1 Tax=Nephila pilipes TaxID=299642 RepID=A0A8X6USR7_NEPPI|nr:hypothetical protein NPIL_461221 [Nephila pilipes]